MTTLNLALPKGRMFEAVCRLMEDAGLGVVGGERNYRPACRDPRLRLKILKPQNIVRMVELGSHDAAFAGHDWIVELGADVRELLDTGLDPVRVVAAVPREKGSLEALRSRTILAASEYENLTRAFLAERGLPAVFVRSYGATEVFPPDDADLVVDNTATGTTLAENGLLEVAELLRSTTRFVANPAALAGGKGELLRETALLLRAVLDARQRVMVEMNVTAERLEAVLAALPCMRRPTVASLSDLAGFSVKAAVPKSETPRLIPLLKRVGATEILEYPFSKVVL